MELNHISIKRNDSDRTNLDLSPLAIAAINLGNDIDGWEENCCLRNTILEEEEIIWNGTDILDSVDEFSEEGQYNEDSITSNSLYQMPSIFVGLNNATDGEIRFLIALFANLNMESIINIFGENAINSIITGVNKIATLFGKEDIIEQREYKLFKKKIEDSIFALKLFQRDKLDIILQKLISDRVQGEKLTGEQLSIAIIDKAADCFNIDKDLTPADSVEAVYHCFIERLLSQYRKTLEKSSLKEREENALSIDHEISELSSKQKEELCKALKIRELSGKTIQKMLLTDDGASILLGVASGLGSPVFLTKIMQSIFNTALSILTPVRAFIGVTSILGALTGPVGLALLAGFGAWQLKDGKEKIDGELLGRIIYTSRSLYGKPFLPSNEILPSWIAPDNQGENAEFVNNSNKVVSLKDKFMQVQQEFNILVGEQSFAKKQVNIYRNKLETIKQKSGKALQEMASLNNEQPAKANKVVVIREKLDNALKQERELQQEYDKLKFEIDIKKTSGLEVNDNLKNLFVQKRKTLKQLQNVIQQLQKDFVFNKRSLKKGYEDINYHKKFIREAEEIERDLNLKIDTQSQTIKVLQNEIEKCRKKKDVCEVNYEKESEIFEKILETEWSEFFSSSNRHFEYDKLFLKSVVALDYSLRLEVEKKLVEIFCAKDPINVTRRRRKFYSPKNPHTYVKIRKDYKLEYFSPNISSVKFIDFGTNEYFDKKYPKTSDTNETLYNGNQELKDELKKVGIIK